MYRRKAVAKDWFGNGDKVTIGGKLEFIQESPYDVTDIEINLEGLNNKMSGYHIHMVIRI
jgi:Cu/Zn superoxide dismutase